MQKVLNLVIGRRKKMSVRDIRDFFYISIILGLFLGGFKLVKSRSFQGA